MGKLGGAVAHDITARERTADVVLPEDITFANMLLSERTLAGLHRVGFRRPSPIQRSAVPVGRCGTDLIVQAKSGTGKTLVFGIIALEMIDVTLPQIQVLIVAPTREIAMQIKHVLKSVGCEYAGLKVGCFIGGMDPKSDIAAAGGCHIAVGTPGRLRHLVSTGHLRIRSTRLFVLDEADSLVTKSFKDDINFIFKQLPEHKQSVAVSATFPPQLEELLLLYLVHPKRVSTTNCSAPLLLGLKQYVAVTQPHKSPLVRVQNKTAKLEAILSTLPFRQCLIFCNLQSRMLGICRDLASKGWPALILTGSMPQTERLAAVAALQAQRCRILLTTDLAARGIDVEQADLVVNLDLPYDTETYLHRIGRSGRFGAPGVAVSIVEDGQELHKLQNMFCDVGGTGFRVALLPDKWNGDVWKEDAALGFVTSLSREENGVVRGESIDKVEYNKKLQNGVRERQSTSKEEEVMEHSRFTGRTNTLESDAKCNNSMSREDAIDVMRLHMKKIPSVPVISYEDMKSMLCAETMPIDPVIEKNSIDHSLLLKSLDVLSIREDNQINEAVVDEFQRLRISNGCEREYKGSRSVQNVSPSRLCNGRECSESEGDDFSEDSSSIDDVHYLKRKRRINLRQVSNRLDRVTSSCESTESSEVSESEDSDSCSSIEGNGRPEESVRNTYLYSHAANKSDNSASSSWYRDWYQQLTFQRQLLQRHIYIREMMKK